MRNSFRRMPSASKSKPTNSASNRGVWVIGEAIAIPMLLPEKRALHNPYYKRVRAIVFLSVQTLREAIAISLLIPRKDL